MAEFIFAIAQGTLPWQQILEVKSAKLANLPSFVALAFRKGLEYRSIDGRVKSAMNRLTSFTNLVRFG